MHSLILPILSLDIILQPHAGLHLSPSSLAMSFRGFGSSFLESALFQDFMFNVTKRSKHSRHMSKFSSDDDTVVIKGSFSVVLLLFYLKVIFTA